MFTKPIDPIKRFSEAVNGRKNGSEVTLLVDEMLHFL